jgi:hypothetical protein
MLLPLERSQYITFINSYKNGNRFLQGTTEYNYILRLENKDLNMTTSLRNSNGVNVPTLTYTETTTTTGTRPGASTEQFFSVSTQPTTLNIGLPPGTTPTGTTRTGTETMESFISTYKMPLIIGAVAIGYFFLRKK